MKLINRTDNLEQPLTELLTSALADNQRVIWLVPGGSNIPISVSAAAKLDVSLTKNLVIMQTDERFVAPDSPDCNWLQLAEAGFQTKQATVLPIITNGNSNLGQTITHYNRIVEQEFSKADVIIGQFGVGADGHVAGIKPDSKAANSDQLVDGFRGDDFTRITLTFNALRQISSALTYAKGDDKRWVFERLNDSSVLASGGFPAGILNEINSSILYNNQLPETDN